MLLHGPLADQLEAMQSWCIRPVQQDRPSRPLNLGPGATCWMA